MNQLDNNIKQEIKDHIFEVTEINQLIKDIFDNVPFFKNISIKGEISNFKGRNINGHIYFSIKDKNSVLKCVMFKYDTFSLKDDVKDGDLVIINGTISSYVNGGYYQVIVKAIKKEDEGDILLKKKLLIEKLDKMGLFDASHKKELPKYPKSIGIIVGQNSAASEDLKFNIQRRWPLCDITFYYSLVQGKEASQNLIQNLLIADSDNNDVLIIARGGGSIEDLAAFDDEKLALTVYNLNTPIISAVGHEINKSVVDLISDKYASTPTGAAELAVPNKDDVTLDLNQIKDYIERIYTNNLQNIENSLLRLKGNKIFSNIENIYQNYFNKIELLHNKLDNTYSNYIENKNHILNIYKEKCDAYNPYSILNKGYCIIKDENNHVICDSSKLKKENNSIIIFKDDSVKVKINKED